MSILIKDQCIPIVSFVASLLATLPLMAVADPLPSFIEFPSDRIPKKFNYRDMSAPAFFSAKSDNSIEAAIVEDGDSTYAALKQFLIAERNGWTANVNWQAEIFKNMHEYSAKSMYIQCYDDRGFIFPLFKPAKYFVWLNYADASGAWVHLSKDMNVPCPLPSDIGASH